MTPRYGLNLPHHYIHIYPALLNSHRLLLELLYGLGVFVDLCLELLNGAGLFDCL